MAATTAPTSEAAPAAPAEAPAATRGETFEHRGATFVAAAGTPIGTAGELAALAAELGTRGAPLPEMTYPVALLDITLPAARPGGARLRLTVNAAGALRCWQAAQAAEHAALATPLGPKSFDWTYTTAYDGDLTVVPPDAAEAAAGAAAAAARGTDVVVVPVVTPVANAASEGLPMERLRRRDPILFAAAIPLYGDDLHDRGLVEVSLKLRVMGDFFFLLVRAFLRLDRVRVWLRDVRWFYDFDTRRLVKDVQVRRGDAAAVISALHAADAADAAAAAGLPTAVAAAAAVAHAASVRPAAVAAAGATRRVTRVALLESPGAVFATAVGAPPFAGGDAATPARAPSAADDALLRAPLRLNITGDEAFAYLAPLSHAVFAVALPAGM